MKKFLSIALLLLVVLAIVSASGKPEPVASESINITYVEWAREVAITHVVAELGKKEGFNIELSNVAAAIMWQSVAEKESDIAFCAWLPITQASYYEKYGKDVLELAHNYEGAVCGIVVPSYVTCDTIKDYTDSADKFNNTLVGIDPGAGIMDNAANAIKNNNDGMGKLTLIESSDAFMIAALDEAIKNKEWIAVTGWAPHWMFAVYDLKILKDPSEIFGKAERIGTIARTDLQTAKPKFYKWVTSIDWKATDYGPVMADINNGMSPEAAAKKFVDGGAKFVKLN